MIPTPGRSSAPVGAPSQVTRTFPYQSYYDASYEGFTPNPGSALLEQQANDGIIRSTLGTMQVEGYAIGNAPWSETPIAVRVQTGGTKGRGFGSAIILRPGETLSPVGFARGEYVNFSSLEWGLPFGWLGGGLATLFVFKSPDSVPNWVYGQREVFFHGFRTAIVEASAAPVSPQRTNFANRFPWAKAYRGTGTVALSQTGTANFAVEPTKTVLRLRGLELAAPEECRLVVWGSDPLDHGSDGVTPVPTESAYWEFNWPTNTAGGWPAHQQLIEVPDFVSKLVSNSWGISIEALNGSPLVGEEVDVARWGKV